MLIDAHCHLWGESVPSKSWWDSFIKVSASLSGKTEENIKERLQGWLDLTGKPMTVKDVVKDKVEEAGQKLVECDIWVEDPEENKTCPGNATVALP